MHAAVVAAGSPGVVARESLPGVALITHRLLAFDVLRIRIRDRSFESRDIWREARPHEHLGDAVNMVGEIQDSNVIYNVRWDGMRWMVTRFWLVTVTRSRSRHGTAWTPRLHHPGVYTDSISPPYHQMAVVRMASQYINIISSTQLIMTARSAVMLHLWFA